MLNTFWDRTRKMFHRLQQLERRRSAISFDTQLQTPSLPQSNLLKDQQGMRRGLIWSKWLYSLNILME